MFPTKLQHVFMLALIVLAPLGAEAARRRAAAHPGLPPEAALQGGYTGRASVVQGDLLTLHISSTAQPLTVEIVNLAEPGQVLMNVGNVTSARAALRRSGRRLRLGRHDHHRHSLQLAERVLRGALPDRVRRALGTVHRAIGAAGKCVADPRALVDAHDAGLQPFRRFRCSDNRVSYQRPYAQHDGLGGYPDDEQLFADWMTAQGLPFEVASDVDLEDSTLLSRYHLVVIPGRSEYWTEQARANIEQFSRNGGHLAVLNGGTMGRNIRLEDERQTIVGAAVSWFEQPLYNPETRFFGTSRLYGGPDGHRRCVDGDGSQSLDL